MADRVFKVMVSSSFRDLRGCRKAARAAILGQDMLPLMMETDPAIGDRGIIENSLAKVDAADAYVVVISNYRYGQVIDDAAQNPMHLSVTELEFNRAEERKLPICVFLMDENVPISPVEMRAEAASQDKLLAFRARANHHDRVTATFTDEKDLKGQAIQTLARLKGVLEKATAQPPPSERAAPSAADLLPAPPAFVARPSYVPGHPFQGRARELGLMREWATSPANPVLVFEAIGGMGKSTVTWEWVTNHAAADRSDWAGRLWYSFYERGADMRDFKITALAYMTRQPPEAFRTRPAAELTSGLLHQLGQAPWLLVLDGLERVLAAYHRADAAQLRDEDVQEAGDTGLAGRAPQDCIRPDDHDLLHQLAGATPSKLLVSSRLMPRALLNASGAPVQGVRREQLHGLAPEDAEAMLRRAGIKGDGERIRRYLAQAFDCHALSVGLVVGMVRSALWAEMDFDQWVDDPRGGAAFNVFDADLRQRQTHILEVAFSGLDAAERDLLAFIAINENPIRLRVLEKLTAPTEYFREREVTAIGDRQWLMTALVDIERRGLIQRGGRSGTLSMNPIVRTYAVSRLSSGGLVRVRHLVALYRQLLEEDVEGGAANGPHNNVLQSGTRQRPASHRFGIREGRVDALPEPLETIDDDVARDLYEELSTKARAALIRLKDTNSHISVVSTIQRLLGELGTAIEDVRPGRLLSLSRSVDSYRRAFSADEARRELLPDVIAMMNDLSQSLSDLLSLFPIVREIETDRVALTIVRNPQNIDAIEREVESIRASAASSAAVTERAVEALAVNDPEIASTRDINLKADLLADKILVVRNFASAAVHGAARSGLASVHGVQSAMIAAGRELTALGAESWQAAKTNLPRGVGDAARIAPLLALTVLALQIAGPIGAIGAIVGGFSPLIRAIRQLRASDGSDNRRREDRLEGNPNVSAASSGGSGFYRNCRAHIEQSGLAVARIAAEAGIHRSAVIRTRACRQPVVADTARRVISALNALYYRDHPPLIEFTLEFKGAVD
ncbi:MAG TPA: DUF4062 domain-containing protein [Acetobacteraceae bacterium]|jgi:hypothetical protein